MPWSVLFILATRSTLMASSLTLYMTSSTHPATSLSFQAIWCDHERNKHPVIKKKKRSSKNKHHRRKNRYEERVEFEKKRGPNINGWVLPLGIIISYYSLRENYPPSSFIFIFFFLSFKLKLSSKRERGKEL